MRVIDNLQIIIKDIHFRVESDVFTNKFSFGLTLEKLEVFTTNTNWEKNFLDRTQSQNKDLPMFKLVALSHFGIYWNPIEDNFLKNEKDEKLLKKKN